MPDVVLLTVRTPRLATPVPDSVIPPFMLMNPGEPMIVPWQLTGSLIVPVPITCCPAATVSVVPTVWTIAVLE